MIFSVSFSPETKLSMPFLESEMIWWDEEEEEVELVFDSLADVLGMTSANLNGYEA